MAALAAPVASSSAASSSAASSTAGPSSAPAFATAPSTPVRLAASAGPAGGTATPRIVGGAPAPITAFPWQVYVEIDGLGSCGGSILGPQTVLTAAHCVTDDAGGVVSPARNAVYVGAGYTDLRQRTSTAQVRTASAVRRHPRYRGDVGEDDVAVLQLATPLDLSGPSVRAIPIVAPGTVLPTGVGATVSGYGQQRPGAPSAGDGRLMSTGATIGDADAGECTVDGNSAVVLCTLPSPNGTCYGDSGGPLVTGSPAVLIGVVEGGRSADCSTGGNRYANLAAPEIRAFIDGASTVPVAPRGGAGTALRGIARAGGTLTCDPGGWSGVTSFSYGFAAAATLQDGPDATYRLTRHDVGRRIRCIARATNPGGTGVARTGETPPIAASRSRPTVEIRKASCRRRSCTVRFDVREPDSSSDPERITAEARRTVRVRCRSGARARRCRSARVQRLKVTGSRAKGYRAVHKRVGVGRVRFRVRAISAASGLRSRLASRARTVRSR